jgi:hypothetical protein
MHKKVLYHVFGGNLCCRRNFRLRLKFDGTCPETRFHLSVKRTRRFKSAGVSLQLTTGSRGERISRCNAQYTMSQGIVKSTGYPLHSSLSPSLPLPCVTVCYHISTGLYLRSDDVVFKHRHSSHYMDYLMATVLNPMTIRLWKMMYLC